MKNLEEKIDQLFDKYIVVIGCNPITSHASIYGYEKFKKAIIKLLRKECV